MSRFLPAASAAFIVAAESPGRMIWNWLSGNEVPAGVVPDQVGPVAFVRRAGTNTLYAPAPSTYRNGFSRTTGALATVV
jgi:hypothetical protein